MLRAAQFIFLALLLGSADVPQVFRLRPQSPTPAQIPSGESLPVLPEIQQDKAAPAAAKAPRAARLRAESRLEIVRYVAGEFARAVQALPSGKKGFRVKAGQSLDEKALRQALLTGGSAARPGDTVQVTRVEFREKEIAVEINGGGRQRRPWRERIQIQASGMPRVTTSGSAPGYQRVGSTLIVDFGRPVPDLSPDELKQYLSGLIDFSKQRSAAVHWVETLPPQFQQAIKDKRASVGMDRDMVIAAIGRPDRKVRERDPDGLETEDWIYGHPPGKTTFVKFAGEKVISVKQYP